MGLDKTSRCVVIGASWGGVTALQKLCSGLDPDLPAAILVVQHIGANESQLAALLSNAGPLPCHGAEDGMEIQPGALYVAPPDRHMILDGSRIRLTAGPKENHARPAIDPLFRSAAAAYRDRCVGVILTGLLDDGTAGLHAIKQCGGLAIVQDPVDAEQAEMPRSAIENVPVDYIAALPDIADIINRLCRAPAVGAPHELAAQVREEQAMADDDDIMTRLHAYAAPSMLTCPDCGGTLFELKDQPPVRYRCHTGHAFTLNSLAAWQLECMERALWSAVRVLGERRMVLKRLLAQPGDALADARRQELAAEIDRIEDEIAALRTLTTATRGPV